ncbi:MAG: class I SAM-dependent methyltransferase [Sedimentisphaerales bacterium]|nr:class I SAM-dependent methyltransferase [Sedimentisphaerales bacterium]
MKEIDCQSLISSRDYDNPVRFMSYYCQIDQVRRMGLRNVLEIGIGNKTVSNYLRQQGYGLTTCDLDPALKPDIVGDIRALPLEANCFDLVMACEILEHLPWEDVPKALRELHRVSRKNVLLSIPYLSAYLEIVLRCPGIKKLVGKSYLDCCIRLPFPFLKPSKSHFWEMGMRGHSLKAVRHLLQQYFSIVRETRPILHPKQFYFVLEKTDPR